MSPVTGLARLPGRMLWCVHMGNFSPVDCDGFKKHNQNGVTKTCIVRDCHSFVDSCNSINKAISHTPDVEIHTRHKSSENHQKRCYEYVYIIKRTLHVSSKI